MEGAYQTVESSSDEASEGENDLSKTEEEAELTGGAQEEGEPSASGSGAWAPGSGFASGRAGSEEDEESDDGEWPQPWLLPATRPGPSWKTQILRRRRRRGQGD